MSRLYDTWLKENSHKLPKAFKKIKGSKASDLYEKPVEITIYLKKRADPTDLSEEFLKTIEQEYAVRYLELLGVAPTAKNVQKIKEQVPLVSCEIKGKWLRTSGWLADALTICPNRKPNMGPKPMSRQFSMRLEGQTSGDIPKVFDSTLNFSHLKKKNENGADLPSEIHAIDISLDTIKSKFLYPFMNERSEPAVAKHFVNYALIGETNSEAEERKEILQSNPEELLNSKLFKFPFDSVTVATAHIREVMKAVEISINEVTNDISYICKNFPINELPYSINLAEVKIRKVDVIKKALISISAEQNVRLVGLMAHFCYWTIFGHLHTEPIERDYFQAMFVNILHLYYEAEIEAKSNVQLHLALLILVLRIEIDYIFAKSYPEFYSVPMQRQIVEFKLQQVITRLLDPEVFLSRLSFLESSLDALHLKPKFRENLKGKYYSTSAIVKSLFPVPQHPRARALLAKKEAFDGKLDSLVKTGAQIAGTMPFSEGKMNYYQMTEPWKKSEFLDIPNRAHLFSLVVNKVKKAHRGLP
mmetsp:Transcript_13228/g.24779  ORF Transcript_13228/g.24779 Transcript_13228/m.24779 type:complete len:530 (+) Transcript_13228:4028-5617(+)